MRDIASHPQVLIIARAKAAHGQTVWGSNLLARG